MDLVLRFVQLLPLFGGLVSATTYFVYDSESKSRRLELDKQKLELNRRELQEKIASRIDVSSTLAVLCPEGRPPCQMRFTLTFPNRGPGPMRVAQNIVSVYHGKASQASSQADSGVFPVRSMGDVGGLVSWGKPVVTETYGGILGLGNTGLVLAGEETVATYDFAIFADPGDWIAVQAILKVQSVTEDGGDSIDEHTSRSEIVDKYCKIGEKEMWSCPKDEPKSERDAG
jgi:hypothetical protein